MKKLPILKLANMNRKKTFNVVFVVLFTLLAIFSITIIGMLLWGLLTSLKSEKDFNSNVIGLPSLETSFEQLCHLSNYGKIFNDFNFIYKVNYKVEGMSTAIHYEGEVNFIGLLFNTIIYSIGSALICALMPAIVAYLCAKYDEFKLSKVVFAVYTAMMCIPIIGSTPSMLTFLRNAGLFDNMFGIFITKMSGSGMYFFVFYAFFKGMSDTYREAAEIDGSSEARIMFRIYFPLAKKVIMTVFLIQFVAMWNDYQTADLYMPGNPTLAYGIHELTLSKSSHVQDQSLLNVPVQVSASMIVILPIVVLFIIFKDKLMGDISLGGIKE